MPRKAIEDFPLITVCVLSTYLNSHLTFLVKLKL
jgi:hypothetical protein